MIEAATDEHQDRVELLEDSGGRLVAQKGSILSGAELGKRLEVGARHETWRATSATGVVAAVVSTSTIGTSERQRFDASGQTMLQAGAGSPIDGLLRVHALREGGGAYIADLWTTGAIENLSALAWDVPRRLLLLQRICETVATMHERGIVHGCLCPRTVVLDDDLNPVVTDVALFAPSELIADALLAAYAAPELSVGALPTASTDIFALGQLVQFVACDVTPLPAQHGDSRFDAFATIATADLLRVAKTASADDAAARYADVRALIVDLSVAIASAPKGALIRRSVDGTGGIPAIAGSSPALVESTGRASSARLSMPGDLVAPAKPSPKISLVVPASAARVAQIAGALIAIGALGAGVARYAMRGGFERPAVTLDFAARSNEFRVESLDKAEVGYVPHPEADNLRILRIVRANVSGPAAGAKFASGIPALTLAPGHTKVIVEATSSSSRFTIRARLADGAKPDRFVVAEGSSDASVESGEIQRVVLDFANPVEGTLDPSSPYNDLAIFPDVGKLAKDTGEQVYYVGAVKFF